MKERKRDCFGPQEHILYNNKKYFGELLPQNYILDTIPVPIQ